MSKCQELRADTPETLDNFRNSAIMPAFYNYMMISDQSTLFGDTLVNTFAPIKRSSIIKEISDQIAQHILEKKLPSGSRLPTERELIQQFGVARSSVREALRMLEQVGLITIKAGPQGGTYVAEADHSRAASALSVALRMDGATMAEVIQARSVLESHLARLAAENATEKDLHKMLATIEETEQNIDKPEVFLKANSAFHSAVAEAAGNKVLLMMMQSILHLIDKSLNKLVLDEELISSAIIGHKKIYEVIARRDSDAAEAALIEHVQRFKNRVTASYNGGIGFQL